MQRPPHTGPATAQVPAFWVDRDYDQKYATDGHSRYAAYVPQNMQALLDAWDKDEDGRQAELAAEAWRIATGPVMAPGYVQHHPRCCGPSYPAATGTAAWPPRSTWPRPPPAG